MSGNGKKLANVDIRKGGEKIVRPIDCESPAITR